MSDTGSMLSLDKGPEVDERTAMWIVLRGKNVGPVAIVDGAQTAPYTVDIYESEDAVFNNDSPTSSWTVAADGSVTNA